MAKTILVTGATGNIGSMVIPQLLSSGANVRAYVHNADKAQGLKDQGVEVFVGDFSDQVALDKAADGVDAVLAITPPNPDAVAQGRNILQAAVKGGTKLYLRLSALGAAADAPTDNGKLHHESDEELKASGLTYTILRPHFYMQNIFAAVESINDHGGMYFGMADGKLGMIDVRDIADSAVSILLNGGYESQTLTLTGPSSITFHDAAEILSKAEGRKINYVPVGSEQVREAILEMGWGEWGAQIMVDYSKAYSAGWGDYVTDSVKVITGNEPRSFDDFAKNVLTHALTK